MLAGPEEAFQGMNWTTMSEATSAPGSLPDGLLDGLIDYAGLYPPAGLDMRTAVENYLSYRRGKYAYALGRFIVDLNRLSELREGSGDSLRQCRLSVIAQPTADWDRLRKFLDEGFAIEAIEIKPDAVSQIEAILKRIPVGLTAYLEVAIQSNSMRMLEAIADAGARVKVRMGGVTAETFPSVDQAASMLQALAERRIPFKATAGLHHPVRSRHPLTYEPTSSVESMHGFLNLLFTTALLHFGGKPDDATLLLSEEDPGAWQVTPSTIAWRSVRWSAEQLRDVRRQSMISFGSCSFEEPIKDLEAMVWL